LIHGSCAWVFAGGEFSPDDIPAGEISPSDFHVCVDRGIEHCLEAELSPGVLIGDLDSVSQKTLQDDRLRHVPRQVHPSRKAASDLELALEWLTADPPDTVIILGVSGGRTDHMLFNWSLPLLRDWPFSVQLIDSTTRAYLVTGNNPLNVGAEFEQTVSLLAMSVCSGVSTKGLQYPLADAVMTPGSSLGLSNVANADTFSVSLESGKLLVMLQRISQH